MRFLVFGGSGMLGTDLVEEIQRRSHEVVAPDVDEFDVTDPMQVARFATGALGNFDWAVNCAAYTAVDKAESDVKLATELNTFAPGYLAAAAKQTGTKFIHISTDFVFDGRATEPYPEEASTHPLGIYGLSKRDGEEAVWANNPNALVVRTAWLYGPNGPSFPRTMIRAFLARRELKVVSDQVGCPTYTADLARVLVELAERNAFPGTYHAVGPEAMSWHTFAEAAIQAWQQAHRLHNDVEIEPILTEDWPTPAVRPKYSVLSTAKIASLGIDLMRPVNEALSDFCARLTEP